MKKVLSGLLSLLLIAGSFPVAAAAPVTDARTISATIYVDATTGSDANGDGTQGKPYATIEKAKEAVRGLDKSSGDIVVEIADGFYALDDTIVFDENDSGNENCTIYYQAAPGAEPVISGGEILDTQWEVAEDVDWLEDGLKAYKTTLVRDEKLRAIYVNGERASMTRRSGRPLRAVGNYSVTEGQADWAWRSGSGQKTGNVFSKDFGLSADTPNPQNIELESGSTWVKAIVCADTLEKTAEGDTQVNFQMPYAAIAQNLGWNCGYNASGNNDVVNVFEWLSEPGEFYFDQEDSTLYYIPKENEDLETAQVVIPELDTLVDVQGSTPKSQYAQNITFEGLTFAYTDWNLQEVDGSYGNATVQACTVVTKYADGNWHNELYRSYDIPPAAIHVTSAHDIKILDGAVEMTGYLGIHLENDVYDCEVTGNYIGHTGGSGIVVGHPQHVYENDTELQQIAGHAGPDKEKFPAGTEAVPTDIYITNNYLPENCYFFPGNSPITTFFTKNLWIEHNFIYKCSYSGMSIGWGWCNFDGDSASQLPGQPSTTSRNLHINYNRIEDYASILQDCGGIYTLGQQGEGTPGGTDYSQYSEFTGNYINVYRETPDWVNSGRWINGFHPDEGSAYILFDSNVITNTLRNVYEMNNWQRKHDLVVTNGFSNSNKSETTAPNCSLEQYVNVDSIWPKAGNNVVLNSGLENEYTYLIDKTVMPDSYYELASNVRLSAGDTLNRRGLLEADDEVWLAPEGTVDFVEGPTMTKAAGNETTIVVPTELGEYKLYIKYANGDISEPSDFTVYVGEKKDLTNVREGQNYQVSQVEPLVLELDTDNYTFTLNDERINDGFTISTEGSWVLKATPIGESEATETVNFTTQVTLANKLLPKNLTVSPEGLVEFAEALNDAGYSIWLAESGLSAFDASDPKQSMATGDSTSMKAPKTPGTYVLSVTKADDLTQIDSTSDATVRVLNMVSPGNGIASYGTPEIGTGSEDPLWNTTPALVIEKHLTMDNGPASGIAKVMWDEENLYVRVEVDDPVLNSDASAAHEKDSVEIFVDESNCKASSYQAGMGQYRISYENEQSFNGAGIEEGFESYTQIVDGGYVVEVKIPFKTVDPAEKAQIGFDVQINDASSSGTRQDIVMWYDETGNSWQSGSNWGVVTLNEKTAIPVEGLSIWLNPEAGLTLGDDGTSVLSWQSQGTSDVILSAESEETAPQLSTNENGALALSFDGAGDVLSFQGVDFNDKSELTLILVTNYTGPNVANPNNDWVSGDKYCPLYVTEDGGWGAMFVSPYQDWVSARFGSGQMFCNIKYVRPELMTTSSITAAVKNGTTEKMYINGENVLTKEGQAAATKNIGDTLYIGKSICEGADNFYQGTISEILVYDRALSEEELALVNNYLTQKYLTPAAATLDSITVEGPDKTEYEVGEELDLTGLTVVANYSDGTTETVTDYEVSGFDSTTAGEKTVTVTYQDKTATFTVTVKKTLSSITVEGPDKTEYELGEELDLTGLTVVANYNDGTTETVTGYEVSGFDSTAAGEKTVTVTYQDKTATFTVTVKEAAEPVDKWILQSMYEYALTCSTEGVVDSAKEYFEKVLAEAEAVLNDPAATEEDVDTAWQNLLEGIWGLGIVQGDKTNLLKLIEAAEAMVENEDKYVTTNWQQLLDALEAAKAVADNGDALDEDIQPAEEALLNAMVLQRYKANKANLQELVEKVQAMDLTVYTDESVAVLQNVLKAAIMVLDDETLSEDDQKVVDQAEIELLSAVEDLELKEDTTTTEPENPDEDTQQPDDTTKPDTQPSEGDNAQEAPATGDSFGYAGMMLLIVVLCGSGMAMALLVYMRKRQAR